MMVHFGRADSLISGRLQTAFLSVLTIMLAWRYTWVHAHRPIRDHDLPAHAWFGWADQGEYYRAAKAWAGWTLDASQHHYPAGYALLAAIFVRLLPQEPFFVIDLLFWAGSLWLFSALAAQLAPRLKLARAFGGTVFFLVTVADTRAFYTWETPWTSTPASFCILLALLMALRYGDGARVRTAFAAALFAGLVIMFRPTDFGVVAASVGVFLVIAAWRRRPRPALLAFTAAMGAGFLAGPALFAVTHVATHGWALGSYLQRSAQIGFEWRLFPLRWVTLMLGPRPLYPDGYGLAQIYWWVLPGMAGIIACCLADQGRRLQHCFVGGTAVIFTCVYLCYRDLQVPGLFGFMNQHYFKWVIPVFGLYCAGLVCICFSRRGLAAASVGVIVMVALSCWRAELLLLPASTAMVLPDGHGLTLPDGMAPLDRAYLAASTTDFIGLYLGPHRIEQAGGTLSADADFKVFPVPAGLMLVPLRILPAQPATLHLRGTALLNPAEKVLTGRQSLVFGLPCAIRSKRAACRYPDPLQKLAGG